MQKLLPDIKQFSDYFTFQHDEAPAHHVHKMVDLLKCEMPDIIPPSLWHQIVQTSTPSITRCGVFTMKIQNVEELRQRIIEEWERLDQHVIDNAVKQWRQCLYVCVAANGGHFKQSL